MKVLSMTERECEKLIQIFADYRRLVDDKATPAQIALAEHTRLLENKVFEVLKGDKVQF